MSFSAAGEPFNDLRQAKYIVQHPTKNHASTHMTGHSIACFDLPQAMTWPLAYCTRESNSIPPSLPKPGIFRIPLWPRFDREIKCPPIVEGLGQAGIYHLVGHLHSLVLATVGYTRSNPRNGVGTEGSTGGIYTAALSYNSSSTKGDRVRGTPDSPEVSTVHFSSKTE